MTVHVEPTPDGWYEQLAAECVARGIAVSTNEYGTPVSVHWCRDGDHEYTCCPPNPKEGPNCCVGDCVSYDPACDASIYFLPDDPDLIEGDREAP